MNSIRTSQTKSSSNSEFVLNFNFANFSKLFFLSFTKKNKQQKHTPKIKFVEEQWKQLVNEKENALHTAENRLRIKMEDADNKLR